MDQILWHSAVFKTFLNILIEQAYDADLYSPLGAKLDSAQRTHAVGVSTIPSVNWVNIFRDNCQTQINLATPVCHYRPGVGVAKPIFSVPLFFSFAKTHVSYWISRLFWQVSPQLSCGDTCQM